MTLTFRLPAVYPFKHWISAGGWGVEGWGTKKQKFIDSFLRVDWRAKGGENRKPVLWFSEISLRETRFEFAV